MRIQDKLLTVTLALGLIACGGGSKGGEEAGGESTSGGEAEYAGAIASTDVETGKQKFEDFCSDCHGEGGDAPNLTEKPHTPAQLRKQIREGSGKMRPIPEHRLGKEDLEAVLAYLASVNAVK